ncbi:TPA: hypothetical protein ACOFDH_000496 [Stenotrophomonas maltophilia]|uniref:hypothetical protein n=1 Tax=Stenotrophomonas muris TaxID=2963283 RepID=UPI0012FDEB89
MRTLAALMCATLLAACATTPPPAPVPPKVVTVTVEKPWIPDWMLVVLPEDAPRQNTVQEAKRLANDRLSTIQAENCRKRLGAKVNRGEKVDPKECEK